MAKVEAFYGDKYTLVRIPESSHPQDIWEIAAFEDCSKNPDLLIVSCDCVTEWEPKIRGNAPMFSYYDTLPDTGIFYVNGRCDYFVQWHREMINYGPLYGLARKIIRRSGLSVDKIPAELYTHYYTTLSRRDKNASDSRAG
jgi:hypothetical protein